MMPLIFEVPAALSNPLIYERVGAVIKEIASGKIVGHIQQWVDGICCATFPSLAAIHLVWRPKPYRWLSLLIFRKPLTRCRRSRQ